ncbi:MAG: hypothetical protein ACYDGR_12520 [Candidatus Dormibacteria bacterium]
MAKVARFAITVSPELADEVRAEIQEGGYSKFFADAALQALRNKRLNALISEDLGVLGVTDADLEEVRERWRDHFGPEVV